MKSILTIGITGAVLLSTVPTFAMTHMDGSMSMNHSMMKSENSMSMSMDHNMTKKMLMKKTVSEIATHFGYTWSSDRTKLAGLAGITNYRGTLYQNARIRTFLLGLNTDAVLVGGQIHLPYLHRQIVHLRSFLQEL